MATTKKPAAKRAAPKKTEDEAAKPADVESVDTATSARRALPDDERPATGNFTEGPIAPPHEVNAALASDRMRALNEDHIAMGARPPTTESDASKVTSAEPPAEEGPIHFRDIRPEK